MRIFLYFFFTALLFPLTLQAECIKGDCNNGHGTRVYSSGSKYSGDWQNDLPHGHGIKNYPNGNRYEGEWLKGKRNGNGITTLADGRVFEETWRKGVVLTQVAVSPASNEIAMIKPGSGPAVEVNRPDDSIVQPETEAEQMINTSIVQTPLSPDSPSKQKVRPAATDTMDSSMPESFQLTSTHPSSESMTEPSVDMKRDKSSIEQQNIPQIELSEDEPAAHRQGRRIQLPAPVQPQEDSQQETTPLAADVQSPMEDAPSLAVRDEVQPASLYPLPQSVPETSLPAQEVTLESVAQVVEEGTVIDPAGAVYVGQLLDHLPHGQGILTFVDGAVYEGEFRHDSREGQGVLTLANGEKYVGQFHNNEAYGQGEYFFPDGRKYVGNFEHDFFCGEGVLTFPDGVRFSGRFRENLPHGFGNLIHPDGRKYVGNFVSGLFHGKGIYTFAGGEKKAGHWLAGEFTGE